jgi:integrase
MPNPYNRDELRTLRATLDERWPKLPPDEADRWLRRVNDGRSPYARVRVHAISCQLEAVIALALHLGLRRSEIFRLSIADVHQYNAYVVVRDRFGPLDNARGVPWTSGAYSALDRWLKCRAYVAGEHDRLLLNLHAAPTAHQPMARWTFDKLLGVHVGSDWTYSRLRVTGAVMWARAGLPLERLRQVLGLSRIADVLPFAQLAVTGTLERDMARVHGPFMHAVEPGGGWSNRPMEPELMA